MEYLCFWIIIGVTAGWLTRLIAPDDSPAAVLSLFAAGIAGAIAGGFYFCILLGHSYGGWVGSTAVAFVSAAVPSVTRRTLTLTRILRL